jgi:hypothetical protein
MSDDHDMHEIRMGIGTNSMDLAEAIDEEFLDIVTEAKPLVGRAVRILLDHGIPQHAAAAVMVGMLLAALEDEYSE